MKTFVRIALLALFVFAFALPALAQDIESTPVVVPIPDESGNATIIFTPTPAPVVAEPAFDNDTLKVVIVCVSALAGLGLFLYARHKGMTTQQAFQSLPGFVTGYGYPMAWNYRYDIARKTPDPSDNEALKAEARMFGYRVTDRPDGSVLLERDVSTPPGV